MKLSSYAIVKYYPIPVPSSKSTRFGMANSRILDSLMHLLFARTRDMTNLFLMNEISRLHVIAQCVASFLPNLLKRTPASRHISPSHEMTNRVK